VTYDNIVRQLLAAGKTWKSYAEDLPSIAYTGDGPGLYARRHNPLSYLSDLGDDSCSGSGSCRSRSSPSMWPTDAAQLRVHRAETCATTPTAARPTQRTSGSRRNIPPLIASPDFQGDGLLIIVFDEAKDAATGGGDGLCGWP